MKTNVLKQAMVAVLTLLSQFAFSGSIDMIDLTNNKEAITPDSSVCLHLKGKMPKDCYGSKPTYTVELINSNKIIKSVVVKEGGSFNFILGRNTWYAIKIYDGSDVPKLISVCTNVPKQSENDLHKLYFEVDELINSAEAKQLNEEALDFPLAVFRYDKRFDTFNYDEDYSNNIKKELLASLLPQLIVPKLYCLGNKEVK
jgi:hypothetical protein